MSITVYGASDDLIEIDTGSTDPWFAVKMLRAASDALGEWAEAQEVAS